MANKINELAGGLSSRLGDGEELDLLGTITDETLREKIRERRDRKSPGRPRKGENVIPSEAVSRATFIVRTNALEKIREISIREGIPQKEIISLLFETLISNYEKKHGEIIPTNRDASSLLN